MSSLLTAALMQRCWGWAILLPSVSAASVTFAAAVTDKQNLALTCINYAQAEM